MYQFGQHEGFSTPTTGTDTIGLSTANASRALFAPGPDACLSDSPPKQQQSHNETQSGPPWQYKQADRDWACSPLSVSDLTREDLQELWRYTGSLSSSSDLLPRDAPSGCESEVEQQQLMSLANMLQARAFQSRPKARHRYSLKPAQLQTKQPYHALSMSSCFDGPRLHRLDSQQPHQANTSVSQSHSLRSMSPPSIGLPSNLAEQGRQRRALLDETQENHPAAAARVPAQHAKPNQVCRAVNQCINPDSHPPERGEQTHHPPLWPEEHLFCHPSDQAAEILRGLSPPQPQPFDPNPSDRSQSVCWAKPFPQSVMSYNTRQLSPSLTQSRHIAQLQSQLAASRPDVEQNIRGQNTRQSFQWQQHDSQVRDPRRRAPVESARPQSGNQPSPELGGKEVPAKNAHSDSGILADSELGTTQTPDFGNGQLKLQQPRASVRLGLKRKIAGTGRGYAGDSAPRTGAKGREASLDKQGRSAGSQEEEERVHAHNPEALASMPGLAEKQTDSISALKPLVRASAASGVAPVITAELGNSLVTTVPQLTNYRAPGVHSSARVSERSCGKSGACDSPAEAMTEVDLLADPADGLTFSPDWDHDHDQDQDDHTALHMSSLGLHHDLPEDPLEGLCVPSWHDLLDEAASHLTPKGFPRTRPALTSSPAPDEGMLRPWQAAQGSHQAVAWCGTALSESPAQKKRKHGGSGVAWEASRSLSWDHVQDQDHANATAKQPSPVCKTTVCPGEESDIVRERTDAQTKLHPSSAEPETVSEMLDRDMLQMTMMEIDSAVAGAQQAQHAQQAKPVPRAAVAQKGRGRHAKRAPARRKAQGKHAGASAAGHDPALGQGQAQRRGQGKEERHQGSSLGKLLPFDSLKGTVMDGKLAELNNRIQATATQPGKTMKNSQPATKPLSAVARPVTSLKGVSSQQLAAQRSGSELSRPRVLVESHGVLRLQSESDSSKEIAVLPTKLGCKPDSAGTSGGNVQSGNRSLGGATFGNKQQQLTHECTSCKAGQGSGAVHLVKLSGTISVGLRA